MYLSKLALNLRARPVLRALGNPYELHRLVMRGFADGLQPGEERVLFRLEGEEEGRPLLLVQSWSRPNWEGLEAAWLQSPAEWRAFAPRLERGQLLAFRLRANPSARKRVGGAGTETRRVGIHDEEAQIAWLQRKLQAGGMQLLRATVSRGERLKGVLVRDEVRHELVLDGVRFDGLLRVEDGAAAVETVARGIGSAKGMGFGLLSLARPG